MHQKQELSIAKKIEIIRDCLKGQVGICNHPQNL